MHVLKLFLHRKVLRFGLVHMVLKLGHVINDGLGAISELAELGIVVVYHASQALFVRAITHVIDPLTALVLNFQISVVFPLSSVDV